MWAGGVAARLVAPGSGSTSAGHLLLFPVGMLSAVFILLGFYLRCGRRLTRLTRPTRPTARNSKECIHFLYTSECWSRWSLLVAKGLLVAAAGRCVSSLIALLAEGVFLHFLLRMVVIVVKNGL